MWTAHGQPILRNAATTNTAPRTPNILAQSTLALYPISVLLPDGTGADRLFQYTAGFSITGTNMVMPGPLSISGRTNKLSVSAGGALLLDGVSISSGDTTNTYNTIISTNVNIVNNLTVSNITVTNVTVQNNLTVSNIFTVNGKNNTLIVTQYVRMPWTTLTMSGSNVSSIDFNAASMFKLNLTNNGFFVAPSNLPGTNDAQTIQVHVQNAGGFSLTLTNSSWVMAGSGTSTNAVVALNTNANAVTVLTFATSPFSATKAYGVVAATGQ